MADNDDALVIRSEEQAFDILKQALESELEGGFGSITFSGWPILEIELDGPGYKSTITPDMAQALVALQSAMNRTYALLVKNQASARHLTDEEKQSIQFKAKVEDGCSLIKIDMGKFADVLVNATVGKMTGTETAITVIGIAAIIGAGYAYKQFLQANTKDKHIAEETRKAIALSEQETKRLELVARAKTVEPRLELVKEDFDGARAEILRGVSDAKTLTMAGVELPRVAAQAAVTKKRESSKEVQLNGTYTVSEASFKSEDATKISVRSVSDGREFSATYQDDSLDKTQLQLLKDAAFGKTRVYLSINGTELRGEVTTARILSVTEQPQG